MALADQIRALRDASTAALSASLDYYLHTRTAWLFVKDFVDQGRHFTVRVAATGTLADHARFAELGRH